MNEPIEEVFHCNRLERLARDKHSSLLGSFVSYKQNDVFWMWSLGLIVFSKLYFRLNLRMGPLNKWFITLGWEGLQGQTLLLTGLICKLRTKWCFLNVTARIVFSKLYFFLTYEWAQYASVSLHEARKAGQEQTF